MKPPKQNNRAKVIDALNAALKNLYHNATLHKWSDDVPGCISFFDFVQLSGEMDLHYINDGGAVGSVPYDLMDHVKREAAEKYKSEAARARFLRLKRKQYNREKSEYFENYLKELYGPVCSYGRGGRTLAPEKWVNNAYRGFSAVQYDGEADGGGYSLSAERAADMLRDVLAFNAWVRAWCDNAPESYREDSHYRLEEAAREAREAVHSINKKARPLAREIKAAGRSFSPAVCEVLKRELSNILQERREALNSLNSALNTLKGLKLCA